MSGAQELLLGNFSTAAAGYQIERSLRFNSADSAYLIRTMVAAATNNTKTTFSCWVKRSKISTLQYLFASYENSNVAGGIYFTTGNIITIYLDMSAAGSDETTWTTTAVFRDVSAWYHVVVSIDVSQATNANKVLLYINGVSQTLTASQTGTIVTTQRLLANGASDTIGKYFNSSGYGDFYLTEYNVIDGQALTPSSFGETDSATGVWKPKAYTGTYGTNGFYLNFSNNTSTQSLGWDQQSNITRYSTAGTHSYTVPNYSSSLVVEVWGGGGGGGQALLPGTDATNGGQSSFNATVVANGGNRGVGASSGVGANGTGGTASGGDTNTTGNTGNSTAGASSSTPSPNSGNSAIAGVVGPGGFVGVTGYPVGSGGGGAYWTGGSVPTAGAGGSGGYSKKTYAPGAISGTITVIVGAGGAAGIGGALNGGSGTAGMVRITVDGATTPSDWYDNNFSVTAGAGNDSLVDSPTAYGTDTGVGGSVRGNYCTLNPLDKASDLTVTNGNLNVTSTNAPVDNQVRGTLGVTSGKWYWEVLVNTTSNATMIGITDASNTANTGVFPGSSTITYGYYGNNGNKYNSTNAAYGNTYGAADIVGVALDLDNGKIWFSKNGTFQDSGDPAAGTNAAYSSISGTKQPAVGDVGGAASIDVAFNFGQRAFAYTAPSGFKALVTTNLPTPTIGATSTTQANDYFNTVLYTGTGSSLGVTGVGFQPDWVWIKERNAAADHGLYDAVRGVQKQLESNVAAAETTETTGLTAFGTDGFTVGALAQLNTSADTYVAWNWNAGGSNATNTSGNITSTVRANTTSGFSIVTYTGNGSANQTVGHGLGVAPVFGILKDRDSNSNNDQWQIFHTAAGDQYGYFTTVAFTGTAEFYPTSGSSTTVTIARGSPAATTNESGDNYVMYLFTPVAGYSAFGSFTGNGNADGPFVFLGFRPAFVMAKLSSATGDWNIVDDNRQTYNDASGNPVLRANLSNAEEDVDTMQGQMDLLSNGFKLRSNNSSLNLNNGTIIYAAFAENPFKYSLAR
jgi:hypothetical protein